MHDVVPPRYEWITEMRDWLFETGIVGPFAVKIVSSYGNMVAISPCLDSLWLFAQQPLGLAHTDELGADCGCSPVIYIIEKEHDAPEYEILETVVHEFTHMYLKSSEHEQVFWQHMIEIVRAFGLEQDMKRWHRHWSSTRKELFVDESTIPIQEFVATL